MLRPLRIIQTQPGLLNMTISITSAIPNLLAVLIFWLGLIVMWGVLGMHLYGHGALSGRCFYPPSRTYEIPIRKCRHPINVTCSSNGGGGSLIHYIRDKNVLTDENCPVVDENSKTIIITLPINMTNGKTIVPSCGIISSAAALDHEQQEMRTIDSSSISDLIVFNNISEW
jgi:hypothetical protein